MASHVHHLSGLLSRLDEAKDAEESAKDARLAIEQRIIELCSFAKDEGSETFTDPEDGAKVTLKRPVSRTVDEGAWKAIADSLPEHVRKIVRYKPEVSTTEYRKLTTAELAMVAQAITAKPGKVSVEVK